MSFTKQLAGGRERDDGKSSLGLIRSSPYPRRQIWRSPRAPGWRPPPAARLRGEPELGGGTSCRWGGWKRSWARGGWRIERKERNNKTVSEKYHQVIPGSFYLAGGFSGCRWASALCRESVRPRQLIEGPCATSPSHKVTAAPRGVKAAQQAEVNTTAEVSTVGAN